jgi:alpha-tubulin N-acetyltransferase 1
MIDRMLREEKLEMHQVPIDRPSGLCLRFMNKHFGLSQYLTQANKYVVFDEFWGQTEPVPRRSGYPMTPPKRINERPTPAAHSRTPGTSRTGLNPITWLPYD